MKKLFIIFAMMAALTLPMTAAFADGHGHGPGHGHGHGHHHGGSGDVDIDIDNDPTFINRNNPTFNNNDTNVNLNCIRNTNRNNNTNTNTNTNRNVNRNNNTNNNTNRNCNMNLQGQMQDQAQDQAQDQSQGQGQCQSNDATFNDGDVNVTDGDVAQGQAQDQMIEEGAVQTGAVTQNVTFEANPQGFSGSADTRYPALVGHDGPDSPDGSALDLNMILSMKPKYSRGQLKAISKKAKLRMRSRGLTNRLFFKDLSDSHTITIHSGGMPKDANLVGITVIEANDPYTTNFELAAYAALDATELKGATDVYIMVDSFSKVTMSNGWGVGGNYTASFINGTGDIGNVVGAGPGYSKSTAGYRQLPWLHVFVVSNPPAK